MNSLDEFVSAKLIMVKHNCTQRQANYQIKKAKVRLGKEKYEKMTYYQFQQALKL